MCGIAGVLAWDDRFRVTREMLMRMSACIAHRGPDGEGIYINHLESATPQRPVVGFVHRRLAVLDPDPRSNQPFTDERGRWLVFNGEIYNFRELRKQLTKENPHYVWRTSGDSEVLLLGCASWGRACLDRLNGMFAFALWDGSELFLARDRMGQKPLFYSHDPSGYFVFASEIGALRAVPWIGAQTDVQSVTDYLTWGFCSRGTIYRSIDKLKPATWMSVTPGEIDSHRWFDPNDPPGSPRKASLETTINRTRELDVQA